MRTFQVNCGDCGLLLDEDPGAPLEARQPCPHCGSMTRAFQAQFNATAEVRSSMAAKGRHAGVKKPFTEQLTGADLHRGSGHWMNKSRVIDRDNDRYRELIVDPHTGLVVHECDEPLSEHQGHGDDKLKPDRSGG